MQIYLFECVFSVFRLRFLWCVTPPPPKEKRKKKTRDRARLPVCVYACNAWCTVSFLLHFSLLLGPRFRPRASSTYFCFYFLLCIRSLSLTVSSSSLSLFFFDSSSTPRRVESRILSSAAVMPLRGKGWGGEGGGSRTRAQDLEASSPHSIATPSFTPIFGTHPLFLLPLPHPSSRARYF